MSRFHPILEGAIDLHCHSAPSIFERRQTDWELVEDLKEAGMAGALLKSHESQTADRATLIRAKEPNLKIYGGLVCNDSTGGLSPFAVDTAIRLGAKCIWMPTISAQTHIDYFTHQSTQLFKSEKPVLQPKRGLTIWDEHSNILPEVHTILELIAEAEIILATGHLSPDEVVALTASARTHGVKKILIQHADMGIAKIPQHIQVELARQGAVMEKCYLACGPDFNDLTVPEMVESMKEIGYESCVMVTDYGQAHNIPPVEALNDFAKQVLDAGVPESAVEQMISTTPHELLGRAKGKRQTCSLVRKPDSKE